MLGECEVCACDQHEPTNQHMHMEGKAPIQSWDRLSSVPSPDILLPECHAG